MRHNATTANLARKNVVSSTPDPSALYVISLDCECDGALQKG